MIRLPHGEHVAAPRPHLREPQCQVDRLRAAVDEEHRVEGVGRQRRETLRELDDGGVVETGVGVEQPPLLGHGVDEPGMRVSHRSDVVEGVEVDPAVGVDEMLTPPPHHDRRVVEVVLLHVCERPVATLQQGCRVEVIADRAHAGHERRRIGGHRPPGLEEGCRNEPGNIHARRRDLHPQRSGRLCDLVTGRHSRARRKRRAASVDAQRESIAPQLQALRGRLHDTGPRRGEGLRCREVQFDAEGHVAGLVGVVGAGAGQPGLAEPGGCGIRSDAGGLEGLPLGGCRQPPPLVQQRTRRREVDGADPCGVERRQEGR